MTIHLTTSQFIFTCIYIILFALVVSLFLCNTNDHPRKHPEQILPYFLVILILLIVFLFGISLTVFAVHYFTEASIVLVTLKYSDPQSKYINVKTELLIPEDAEKVDWYFKNRIQTPFFYEYHLLDDKNHMQIFQCPESDLLQRVKDTVVKDEKGELRTASNTPFNT